MYRRRRFTRRRANPFRRKRAFTRRRVFKRRSRLPRPLNFISRGTRTFNIVQNRAPLAVSLGVSSSGPTFTGYAYEFFLSQIDTEGQLTSAWDQYKIRGIAIDIVPLFTSYIAESSVANPDLFAVFDPDDNAIPATLGSLLNRNNVIRWQGHRKKHFYIKNPTVQMSVNSTGTALGQFVVNKQAPWIDRASASVIHRGFKWGGYIETTTNPSTYFRYHVYMRYYISLRYRL